MDLAEYVRGIRFRILQPWHKRPHGLRKAACLLRRLGVHLEAANTRLPCGHAEMKRRLRAVCRIPRMSTFAIGAIINRAVSVMPSDQAFVNVGVWNGFTFFSGLAGNEGARCVGIDDFSHSGSPRDAFLRRLERLGGPLHTFYEMDFREYFGAIHRGPIGVYLFDGPHRYEDHLDGLTLAEPFFAEACVVLIDDTNWNQVRRATSDFLARSPNRYRLLLDARTPHSGHPAFWNGLMVLQMTGPRAASRDAERILGPSRVEAAESGPVPERLSGRPA